MAQIKFYLFGPPRLERDGKPLEINLRKALALLVYLAVTRQVYSRDALATFFWPAKDQQGARANLRRTLYDLGQLVGEQLLEIGPETVSLDAGAAIWLDIEEFQAILAESLPSRPPAAIEDDAIEDEALAAALPSLAAAVELYTGDFLAGFTLPDCPDFDDWQFFQREDLRQRLASALQQLAAGYETLGKIEEALPYARRWLQLDPLDEPVHRRLMQLYALAGQPGAALRQYDECVRILDAEMGVPPEPETTALYEAIRTRRFPPQEQQRARRRASRPPIPAGPARKSAGADSLPHHLPVQPTPFVGRRQELADLLRRLQDPACRLLTLVGPGGMGKTRLALEAARQLAEAPDPPDAFAGGAFADGVFFVPLQTVGDARGLISAMIQATGLHPDGSGDLHQQLLDALHKKQMLLVLDNFEHLPEATELLASILAAAPQVKLLVTSREALGLQEAWFYPIAGMRFPKTEGRPDAPSDEGPLEAYDAVRFFVQCARPVQPDFALAAEQAQVARICRLVGGTPLALELAAAWLKVLSCRQIADEIERSLDILTARHQNIPARHRSMRVVLEQSWQRMTEAEQGVLRRLAVFQGGCSPSAAEQVTGASLPLLTGLVERALLHVTRDGRYALHELVRQFAEEQLRSFPGEREQAQARHCAYYALFLQQQTPNLKGKRQQESFAEIMADLANVRAAWQYAVAHKDIGALEQAAEGLWIFSDARGAFQEGETAFQQAIAALTAGHAPSDLPEQQTLVGFLLAGQGYLCYRRGDWRRGRSLMEQGVALLQQSEQPASRKQAIALLYLGWLVTNRMEQEQAQRLGEESLALFTAADDRWGIVAATELLSRVAMLTRPLPQALQLLQEGLALSEALEAHKLRGGFLHKLGEVAVWLGDYAHAQQWLAEARAIAQTLGALPGLNYVLRDLGRLAVCQGRYAEAMRITEEGLAVAEEIGPQWTKRTMLLVLADAHRLQGNLDEAERQYRACLQASQASEFMAGIAACLSGLGALALARGELSQAEQLQQEALSLWEQLGQEPEIALALCRMGHVLAAAGPARHQEARQCYGKALQLALKHKSARMALDAFVGVAQLYARAGEAERALDLLRIAVQHAAGAHETQEAARRQMAALGVTATGLPVQLQGPADWQLMAQQLVGELVKPASQQQGAIPNNLMTPAMPFVGRAHELNEIVRSLYTPACRLLTVVGPGGIGKSRLALQVAQRLVDGERQEAADISSPGDGTAPPSFADGVFFVPLQAVSTASGLISAIAEAAGFQFYSDTPPRQQLINFLRKKQMLLVLDSMEHVPEGESLVSELLAEAPGLKLLVTSQRSLNLYEEWFHPLAGMALPRPTVQDAHPLAGRDAGASEEYADSVQLFVLCARRARANFAPEVEWEHVTRICRLVGGTPLALELAAAWLKVLSCKQIADEIERSLDILTARHQNIPARHRSMRVVLEQSWQQLLDEGERAALKRLSLFRGGFTHQAALEVAGASLLTLATLVEKAVIWVTPSGRYQMHELLRQFAHKQLAADPHEERAAQDSHSAYYLHFLTMRAPLLSGKTQRTVLDEIGQDIENVRLAWEWAAQQHQLDALDRAVEPLYHFYQGQGRYQEGKEIFSRAWDYLQQAPEAGEAPGAVLVRVLARRGAFCHLLCEYEEAGHLLQECLARAQALDQRREIAFVLNFLGQLAVWRGEQAGAKQYLLASLSLSRELGDKSGTASALEKLANLTHATFGEYAESKALAAQSLALSRELGRPDWVAYALDALGYITFCLGEYDEAESNYRESLSLFEAIDDRYGIAMALGGMGLVLWAVGKNGEAATHLQKSLHICRTIGHQGQVAGRLAGLARIANDLGDYIQAQQLAQEGLAIARELGSPVYLSHLLYCLGESAYRMGDLPAARAYLLEALHVTSETGLLAYLAIALYHYAMLLIQESEGEPAGAAQKQAKALELLALVQRHPATWHVYTARAGQQYGKLAARLPGEVTAIAAARAASHTLAEVVAMLSSDLEAMRPAPPTVAPKIAPRLANE